MNSYCLKYTKGDEVKYISHLDFIRLFSRVLRRSNLPVSYSQGFNPHPIMTVALPISVGATSQAELMRVNFDADFSVDYIKDTLNNHLPKGISILEVVKDNENTMKLSKIDACKYLLTLVSDGKAPTIDDINDFLSNEEIITVKKSKSGEKEENIKKGIIDLKVVSQVDNIINIEMLLSAGSTYNLKPDTVLSALKKYISGFSYEKLSEHRLALFEGKNKLL